MNESEKAFNKMAALHRKIYSSRTALIAIAVSVAKTGIWKQHPNPKFNTSLRAWLRATGGAESWVCEALFTASVLAPFCELHSVEFDPTKKWSNYREAIPTLRRYVRSNEAGSVRRVLSFCYSHSNAEIRSYFRSSRGKLANYYRAGNVYVVSPKDGVDISKLAEHLNVFSEFTE